LLPALAAGDADRADDRGTGRCGGGRVLAGESGIVRGLPVSAPRLLDPGFSLTLRPMRYPQFFERYRDAVRNGWTVEEVDFAPDINDLRNKLGPAERHLIERLVAFFATGDAIVCNNLV